jgi:hypothetical protein
MYCSRKKYKLAIGFGLLFLAKSQQLKVIFIPCIFFLQTGYKYINYLLGGTPVQTGELEIMAQIADLKNIDYRNTLAISVLIELLIEQGLFTREQFAQKAQELEKASLAEMLLKLRKKK